METISHPGRGEGFFPFSKMSTEPVTHWLLGFFYRCEVAGVSS